MNTAITPRQTARFWSRVDTSGECWTWTGSRMTGGYGQMSAAYDQSAHRFSWRLHFGPIPDGLFVCHRCDNPPCVRPDHLFLGTHLDNMHDARDKGRMRHGPRAQTIQCPRCRYVWSNRAPAESHIAAANCSRRGQVYA